MTDENDASEGRGAPEQDPVEAVKFIRPDWYLQKLTDLANRSAIEFPITLFVSGVVVSGVLTGGHRYFEGIAGQYKEYFGDNEFTEKNVDYLTQGRELYGDKFEPTDLPTYIHLREARVVSGNAKPYPEKGSWWRGRIANVDAFHIGTLIFDKS